MGMGIMVALYIVRKSSIKWGWLHASIIWHTVNDQVAAGKLTHCKGNSWGPILLRGDEALEVLEVLDDGDGMVLETFDLIELAHDVVDGR